MVLYFSVVHCERVIMIIMSTVSLLFCVSGPPACDMPAPGCTYFSHRPETPARNQATPSKPRWSQQEMNLSATDSYLDQIINV